MAAHWGAGREHLGASEHPPPLMCLESPGDLVQVQTLMQRPGQGLPGEAEAGPVGAAL